MANTMVRERQKKKKDLLEHSQNLTLKHMHAVLADRKINQLKTTQTVDKTNLADT